MRPGYSIALAIAAVLYGAPSPASAADAASTQADPTFGPVGIAIGIGGIAAMALFAWLVPLLRRRRRVEPRSSDTRDDAQRKRTTTEEQVTAALHRRTLRRARVRLEEDPIMASMGVSAAGPRADHGVSRGRPSARRSPPT